MAATTSAGAPRRSRPWAAPTIFYVDSRYRCFTLKTAVERPPPQPPFPERNDLLPYSPVRYSPLTLPGRWLYYSALLFPAKQGVVMAR